MSALKIKLLAQNAKAPARATAGSAGMDLYACLLKDITIEPQKRALIPTGISIELESAQYVALLFARSGLAIKQGISLSNAVGVIDSDYRGEVCVGLTNFGDTPFTVHHGDRIAQMVIMPVDLPEIEVCDTLSQTARAAGGFGSTGISG